MIVEGLGYCCPYAFFRIFRDKPSRLLAARLGVTFRAINHHRQMLREGTSVCLAAECCMKRLTD